MANTVSRTISDATLSRIIQIESGGRPNIKAGTSSATGLGQFLDGTWIATVKLHRPDLMKGRNRAQILKLRLDPSTMIEILARFTEDNARALGRGYQDGDLYLAHFAGVGVARKLLRANAAASASDHFSPDAIRANRSILEGKTVGQVRGWAAKKMAGAGKVDWIARYWVGKPQGIADIEADEAVPTKVETTEDEEAIPIDEEEAAPMAKPLVEHYQGRLKALGYSPGGVDGEPEGLTVAAVSRLQHDRKLPITGELDELTKASLDADETPAQLSAARVIGEPEGSRIVAGADKTRKVGLIASITAAVAGFFEMLQGGLEDIGIPVGALIQWITPIWNVIGRFWWVILGAAGAFIFWQAVKIRRARVDDFQKGKSI